MRILRIASKYQGYLANSFADRCRNLNNEANDLVAKANDEIQKLQERIIGIL